MNECERSAVVERNAVELPPPSQEQIRAQLDRILASPEFRLPERGRSFLNYIVEETLAGRTERLKAYSIAVDVFGRDEGFTQDDPVVRIEAGRLRRALERYYLVAGQSDPIRIDIPKGGYVPVCISCAAAAVESKPAEAPRPGSSFAAEPPLRGGRQLIQTALIVLAGIVSIAFWVFDHPSSQRSLHSATATTPDRLTLMIAPFADLGEGAESKLYTRGLTEELLTELPRFKQLRVFDQQTSRALSLQASAAHIQQELGARYLLAGGVRVFGGRVRVTARLVETGTGEILWSQTYDDDLRSRDPFAIQTDIAGKVASAVAQPYGAISQADAAHLLQQPPDDLNAYLCRLRFSVYRRGLSTEQQSAARRCLEGSVARFPTDATT